MKFNKQAQQAMLSQGYDMRLAAQNPNMQYMGGVNPDLLMAQGYDDYYEEDYDTEEAEAYQQLINMKGPNAGLDPTIAHAEQLLGEGFEIMEEELDEDYEPTGEEIEEYAKYLGMDLKEDKDMFFIAKEGLKAPLPNPWKPCRSPGGNIYYFNFKSKELQKEHPCDDYYKKLYQTERQSMRRKKEEQVIKKQIKQQQKQMTSSMGSTAQNPQFTQSAGQGPNSSLQQMLLMNISNLDNSTSVVNERVQFELEQLMDEHEEKKIQHERARRDELKKLEQERTLEKSRLQAEAKQEVQQAKQKLMKAMTKDKEQKVQARKEQLQLEKEKKIQQQKEQARGKVQKEEKQTGSKWDKKREEVKREEEQRHKLDGDIVKERYQSKLQLERERIRDENNRLLEESGDIDFQVRVFKSELFEGQIDQQKYDLEDENRKRLKEIKEEQRVKLEKERERIVSEMQSRLEREKEREQRKQKGEWGKLEDRKEELKRESQGKVREEKRKLEKQMQEQLRMKRNEQEEETDRLKEDVKKQVVKGFQFKEEKVEKEGNKMREEMKEDQIKYENKVRDKNTREEEELERQYSEDFQKERREFEQAENEKSESYQQIIKEISALKARVKELQAKVQALTRELKMRQKECQDLDLERKGKERQLKAQSVVSQHSDLDLVERQLQREVKDKQEEIDRIKNMIRDKKLSLEARDRFHAPEEGDFGKLTQEIDSIKLLILDGLRQQDEKPQKAYQRVVRQKRQVQIVYDYSLSEITAFIQVHLPRIKHKREKYENDRVIMRQLIANIERNRVKIRKELLDAKDAQSLSHTRRIAIQSIKEKVDEQARILEQEEQQLKDKGDFYRRQEDKLRVIKQKIDIIEGQDKFEDPLDDDRKDALMREVQIDYDKYLKLYQSDKHIVSHQPKSKPQVAQQDLQAFKNRWSDYLLDDVHDMKPMLGLEGDRQPHFTPLYQKYELSQSVYKNKVYHLYNNEVDRVKESRSNMKQFLDNQQQWLSKLRSELSFIGASGGGGKRRTMVNVGSNETLFQLKNNLSYALDLY